MSEISLDEIAEKLEELRLASISHRVLLQLALSELAETSEPVRNALEDLLWQAHVDAPDHKNRPEVIEVLPDMYDSITGLLEGVSEMLSTPLQPKKSARGLRPR